MAAFFANQLDFIFFFYGLAFILLGSVCFAIGRGARGGAMRVHRRMGWGRRQGTDGLNLG